jgi:excisionase family DNA binding protein
MLEDTNSPEPLVKAKAAARFLGLSVGYVRKRAADGDIPCVKMPTGGVRFRMSELEAWLNKEPVGSAAAGSAA